ncbi:MAG: acyl-CoA dehydrogenase [Betaproteobacteria bacterium]|nr:acyl-CoA dehydrogenase [Betaproteobacteria bacterium]
MGLLIWFAAILIGAIALAYFALPGWAWAAAIAGALVLAGFAKVLPGIVLLPLGALLVVLAPSLLIPSLRRWLYSGPVLTFYRKILPPMSETERDALEAGTVWWDGDLFSGRPDWNKLLATRPPHLTAEEQAFLDNDTGQLCAMIDEWKVITEWHDLPPSVWRFIKDRGFLGMIIPKEYGGKGFSAYAHSQVVTKLSTRTCAGAVSVMVPNSLGPAELLMHYGTESQKNHYLPRLARGEDIPCFALTSPLAGSDAASLPDTGIVCMGQYQGKETLGLSVTWDKRYITLGPIATVLGLAFRAQDPDNLLGGKEDLGITCALIPTTHPGVRIGRRHRPMIAEFQNGPNWGTDVFIPMDFIIGGQAMIGEGWKMLMNCLAAGRSISLPGNYVGMSKLAVRAVGGYARVRKQFKTPIGKFEGIEEALTRMGGNLYMMDAAATMTAGAIDLGEKPAVLSAIVKYHLTERGRQVVNDGMDIVGGKGICMGPNNFLAVAYMSLPIGVTVEGANILTRSLIIFGQGAIRCHPYVLREFAAAREPDRAKAVGDFDAALWGHIGFTLTNAARALVLGLTGSHFVATPDIIAPETRRYYQQLSRFSAAFAFLSDVSMLVLGGGLKRREKLSARLGDILSLLYLSSATLKRFEDEGRQAADAPLLHWAIWDAMFKAQNAFEGVLANYPSKVVAWLLRRVIFPLGRPYVVPSDRLGHEVASLLIEPSATRDRLTRGTFIAAAPDDPVALIEAALRAVVDADAVESRIRAAAKAGTLAGATPQEHVANALATGLISAADAATLQRARELSDRVIHVDDFAPTPVPTESAVAPHSFARAA